MSRLFAFNNAEDMVVHNVPAGHYDAEQQLWVADDVSRASINVTTHITTSATMSGGNVDVAIDVETD